MVGKAQKSHGVRSGLYGGCSNGVPPIFFFQTEQRIRFSPQTLQTALVPNYWLKEFPTTYSIITELFNTITEKPKEMPDWLSTGIICVLPKSEDTKEPKKNLTFTCLWKNLICQQQSKKDVTLKVKGANIIYRYKTIFEDFRKRKEKLSITWIDFQKHLMVFHIAGHSVELIRMNNKIVKFTNCEWKN
jgi:hypothetical protein